MTIKKNQHIKLWFVIIVAVIFWIIGTGSYRDLSAGSDETYKGLKLFSDVIELIEKHYVDSVDTKELIQNAVSEFVTNYNLIMDDFTTMNDEVSYSSGWFYNVYS